MFMALPANPLLLRDDHAHAFPLSLTKGSSLSLIDFTTLVYLFAPLSIPIQWNKLLLVSATSLSTLFIASTAA